MRIRIREYGSLYQLLLFLLLAMPVMAQRWPVPHVADDDDPSLLETYKELNREYFGGKLPEANVTVSWDGTIETLGELAATYFTNYEGEGEQIHILISPRFQDCKPCVEMVILHELCHVKLREKSFGHGRPFQKEMRRLVRLKAFDHRW